MAPARVESLALSGLEAIPPEYVRPVEERPTDCVLNLKGGAVEDKGPQIPVVDVAGWDSADEEVQKEIGRQVAKASREWGVMQLLNHGISETFVTFKHMDGAQKALKEPSKKIDSRMTACQMASAGPAPAHPPTETTGRKIYVSNVPADIPAEKLLKLFFRNTAKSRKVP